MCDRERMFEGLLDASHGMSLENLPALVREQAAHAGLHEASIYLADLQEDVLRLVTGHGLDAGDSTRGQAGDELTIDGTLAGRAYARLTPQRGEELKRAAGGHRCWTEPSGWASCGWKRATPGN